jgi:small GTP-binding protein
MRVLLMGNPNVGKIVVFSRLTGVRVMSSNYPGTTVGFTEGRMRVAGEMAEVIDVPGTYTLDPTCEAEEVALKMMETGDVVVDVVDATNLERNLFLTLQLLERDVPVVVALNMWDDTAHRGITIDIEKLRSLLGVPVVPTVAVSGQGMKTSLRRYLTRVRVSMQRGRARSAGRLWEVWSMLCRPSRIAIIPDWRALPMPPFSRCRAPSSRLVCFWPASQSSGSWGSRSSRM